MAKKKKPPLRPKPSPDDGFEFCALRADFSLDLATPARLPRCKWWLENTLPSWQRDDVRAAISQALGAWSTVADVQTEEARSPDLADLIIRCVNLGGPQGVLADCELPGPRIQHMRLDTSERWTLFVGEAVPAGLIDIYRVILHEGGHYWGMGHAPAGSLNVMAPNYSKTIWVPRSWEIEQMQAAYGKPRPGTPTQPPPSPGEPFTLKIFGADYIEVNGVKFQPPITSQPPAAGNGAAKVKG
jgi:hypothetical protein